MNSACGATVVVARSPLATAGVGEVEQLEHVVQVVADDRQVDRPPAAVVRRSRPSTCGRTVVAVLDLAAASRPSSGRACRRRPAARRGSPRPRAGGGSIRQSSRFSGSTSRRRRVVARAHPVGAREHDRAGAVALTDQPPLDEPPGQPVEQLGLRRGARRAAPKLSGDRTSPWPKCHCQIRLTITRLVSGWSGSVSQRASSSRPLCVAANGRRLGAGRTAGNRRGHDRAERQVARRGCGRGRRSTVPLGRRPSPSASPGRLLQRGQLVASRFSSACASG